jgi:DNA-binding transcriptional ArsR family regulator
MTPITTEHPQRTELSEVLYALADPSRLLMINELTQAPEIASTGFRSFQAARGTFAHHLKVLRYAGLIYTRDDGGKRWIALRRMWVDTTFPGLLDAVLAGFFSTLTATRG